jgi:hypothetical protein
MEAPILDPYSQIIANAVFQRWPEWKSLGEVTTSAIHQTSYFSLVVKPINPKIEKELYIMTEREVIVGFDYYHSHLDWRAENDPRIGPRTVEFIESILDDRLLAVSWWVDGQMRVGSCCDTDAPFEKSHFVTGEAVCRVRSWTGKHDKDILYP